MRPHTRSDDHRTRHVFATDDLTVRVAEFHAGASVTIIVDDGANVTLEFIPPDCDGAAMADRIMIALRDAARVDARPTEQL